MPNQNKPRTAVTKDGAIYRVASEGEQLDMAMLGGKPAHNPFLINNHRASGGMMMPTALNQNPPVRWSDV